MSILLIVIAVIASFVYGFGIARENKIQWITGLLILVGSAIAITLLMTR